MTELAPGVGQLPVAQQAHREFTSPEYVRINISWSRPGGPAGALAALQAPYVLRRNQRVVRTYVYVTRCTYYIHTIEWTGPRIGRGRDRAGPAGHFIIQIDQPMDMHGSKNSRVRVNVDYVHACMRAHKSYIYAPKCERTCVARRPAGAAPQCFF